MMGEGNMHIKNCWFVFDLIKYIIQACLCLVTVAWRLAPAVKEMHRQVNTTKQLLNKLVIQQNLKENQSSALVWAYLQTVAYCVRNFST